jgi:hypothetical protein
MRARLPEKLELGRVVNFFGADDSRNGRFILQGPCGAKLQIVAENENQNWEHVSVSLTKHRRSPNWPEMCFVKDLFWDEEECVVQFHPPLSQYARNHRYCLHLWKPTHQTIPAPPASLVGIVGLGPDEVQPFVDAMVAQIISERVQ